MKLSNKIFGAAAAIAIAAVMLTGCPQTVGTASNINEPIDSTNKSTTDYMRGYKSLATKHTSASALITLEPTTCTHSGGPGVIGFIFGIKEGDQKNTTTNDTSKCFSIIGLKRDSNNVVSGYVSYFKNASVSKDTINTKKSFTDVNGTQLTSASSGTAYEHEILKSLSTKATADKDIIIRVDVVAAGTDTDKDGTVEDGEGDGSYKVTISTTKDDGLTADKEITHCTIPASDTGDTTAKQYDLGLYTNVYMLDATDVANNQTGNTLKGKLTLVDIVNEAEVEE